MKGITKIFVLFFFIAAIGLSFFAGSYVKEKAYADIRKQQCCEYISSAIDITENRDLSENGIKEAVISYVFAAHELCDTPSLSAQLNDIHFTLAYKGDTYIGKEAELTNALNDILQAMQ